MRFGRTAFGVRAIYQVTPDFRFTTLATTDEYQVLHKQLEARGELKHSLDQCPERAHPLQLRSWQPDRGWLEMPVECAAGQAEAARSMRCSAR